MAYVAPAIGRALPALVAAFRTGDGVPYSAYGAEAQILPIDHPFWRFYRLNG